MLEDTNSLDAAQMRMDDKILHIIMNAYFDNITFIISWSTIFYVMFWKHGARN